VRDRFAAVLAQSWFRFLIPFSFVEGAVMVGLYNFFGAAMQRHGSSVLMSGLVTSAYGLAAIGGGALVGRLDSRMSGAAMFGWGTALLAVGYVCAARTQSVAGILVAGVLAGLALVVGQSALQAWVLEAAAPETRGSATALIACSVFTGASLSTAAVRPLANGGDFTLLFALAAAVTVPVSVLGTVVRVRFARSTAPRPAPPGEPALEYEHPGRTRTRRDDT
jgi:MFS family permease